MKLILQRFSDNRDSTLGLLFKVSVKMDLYFYCYTIEDQFQTVKVAHETRIPAGLYKLALRKEETPKTLEYRKKYPWFKWHIEVTSVPNFTGVYIHIGNTDEDTDGCILLGDNADNNQLGGGTVSNSTQAFRRFYGEITDILEGKEQVFLEIRDEKNLQ